MFNRSPFRLLGKNLCAAASSLVLTNVQGAEPPATVTLSNLPIEQLMQFEVDTAAKHPQKISDVPAAVSIVSAEDIKAYGYRSLSDILNSLRGLHTSYDRNYNYLGVRGFSVPGDYNTRVLLLVDGYRHNDSVYDQASIGSEFDIDVDLIERVEFLAGPASAVYGSNALFGIINVVTKTGHDFQGGNVSAETGSYRTSKGRATAGGGEDGSSWLLSATRYNQRGQDLYYKEYDTPRQNDGIAVDADNDRSTSFLAKYKNENFSLFFSQSDRIKGIPTASYEQVFNDNDAYSRDTKTNFGADYRHRLDESTLTAKMYAGRSVYKGDYIYADPARYVNRDESEGIWFGAELQLARIIGQHTVVAGTEYRRDLDTDQSNFDVDPYARILDDQRASHTAGIYFQDEYRISTSSILNTGLRVDTAVDSETTASPRIGLVHALNADTTLKLLYGSAYRTPNSFEKFYYPGLSGIRAPESLDNERLNSSEILVDYTITPSQRLSFSTFRNEVKDLIALTTSADGDPVFRNISGATIEGVEMEWQGAWANGVRTRTSYSWQRSDGASEEVIGEPPRHLVKLNITGPVYKDSLSYGLDFRAISARKNMRSETAGYGITDLTLRLTPHPEWEASATVYNMFDQKYGDPGASEHLQDEILQDRRTFRLRLEYWL